MTLTEANGDPLPVTEYGTTNDHRTDRSYLERAAKKNVDSKRDENGNCRCSDGCRQLRGSAFPQEQSDSGHNVSKARHEVEPKHEGNGSRQVGSRLAISACVIRRKMRGAKVSERS